MIEADLAHHLQLRPGVDAGHLDVMLPGELDGVGSHAAAGPVDQDAQAVAQRAVSVQRLPGQGGRLRDAGGIDEIQPLRHAFHLGLRGADMLGEGAEAPGAEIAVDPVSDLPPRHAAAGRFDFSGHVAAGDLDPRPEQAEEETIDQGLAADQSQIPVVDGNRMDTDPDFIVGRFGALDLLDVDDVGRAVFPVHCGLHPVSAP